MLQEKRAARDFAGLFELYAMLADTLLWDSARSEKYLACIELDQTVWQSMQ